MTAPDAATATQIRNIERATGRTVAQWSRLVAEAGPVKHGEIVAFLKSGHGLTHGNANALAHRIRQLAAGGPAPAADLLAAQYSRAKAALRPVYDELVRLARSLGDDIDVVINKTGVSLRRRKQFGLIEVPSAKRVELGLNLKQVAPTERLRAAGGMCTHRVALSDPADVDDEVAAWLRRAYDAAG